MADVDRDGDIDLVSANYYSRNVSVLANLGDGSFAPPYSQRAGPTLTRSASRSPSSVRIKCRYGSRAER
jgi:hypothetical protein